MAASPPVLAVHWHQVGAGVSNCACDVGGVGDTLCGSLKVVVPSGLKAEPVVPPEGGCLWQVVGLSGPPIIRTYTSNTSAEPAAHLRRQVARLRQRHHCCMGYAFDLYLTHMQESLHARDICTSLTCPCSTPCNCRGLVTKQSRVLYSVYNQCWLVFSVLHCT